MSATTRGPRPPHGAEARRWLQRFDRIGIGVRCAYNPQRPQAIAAYLGMAAQLGALGVLPRAAAQGRVLEVLLQAAHDSALPLPWRRACAEYAVRPVARLRTLLGPCRGDALAAALAATHEMLDAAGGA